MITLLWSRIYPRRRKGGMAGLYCCLKRYKNAIFEKIASEKEDQKKEEEKTSLKVA